MNKAIKKSANCEVRFRYCLSGTAISTSNITLAAHKKIVKNKGVFPLVESLKKRDFPINEFMAAKKAKIDEFINGGGYEKHLLDATEF